MFHVFLHRPSRPTIHNYRSLYHLCVQSLHTQFYARSFTQFQAQYFNHSCRLYPSHSFKFSIQPTEMRSHFDRLIHRKLGTTMIPSLFNVVMKGQNQNRCLTVYSLLQKGNFFKQILTYSVDHYPILKQGRWQNNALLTSVSPSLHAPKL